MTTKSRVVYTSIMGSIDKLNEVVQPNADVDYLCFTDNQTLRSKTWRIILCRDYFNSPRLTAKVFKLFPHLFFPDALESLWVDGNFEINGNITIFLDEEVSQDKIKFFHHPVRSCLYSEARACRLMKLDNPKTIRNQISKYKKEGVPKNIGLIHGAVIYRRHNEPVTDNLMEAWWKEITDFSIRDQLSFNYLIWKHKVKLSYFDGDLNSCSYFRWKARAPNKKNTFRDAYIKLVLKVLSILKL